MSHRSRPLHKAGSTLSRNEKMNPREEVTSAPNFSLIRQSVAGFTHPDGGMNRFFGALVGINDFIAISLFKAHRRLNLILTRVFQLNRVGSLVGKEQGTAPEFGLHRT